MRCPVGFRPLFLLGDSSARRAACGTEMDSRSVAERVREIAEQAAIDHGVELVHAEVAGAEGHPTVRVFIDKPGGVTHDDCAAVSLKVGTGLDVEGCMHWCDTL